MSEKPTGRSSGVHGWAMWLPALLPLAALALWLAGGRERLTRSGRQVTRQITDVFGDPATVEEFVRGPVLGYYVGLDAVIAATVAAVVIFVTIWLWSRLRKSKGVQV